MFWCKIKRKLWKIVDGIKKNYDFFQGSAAIIISVVAIIISIQQTRIYEFQTDIQKQQIIPHFNVDTFLSDNTTTGKLNEHSNVKVENSNGDFYSIECEAAAFLDITYGLERYMMPALAYYLSDGRTGEKRNIVYNFFGYRNNLKILELSSDLQKYADGNNNTYGSVSEKVYIKIYYQDIFNNYKTLYFDASKGAMLNKAEGEKIFTKYQNDIKDLQYKPFDKLDINDITKFMSKENAI